MNKVTFQGSHVFQNGVVVGHLDGTKEVYVVLYSRTEQAEYAALGFAGLIHSAKTVARFKYRFPKSSAKKFLKFALSRFSPEEVIVGCAASTPMDWVESQGGLDV